MTDDSIGLDELDAIEERAAAASEYEPGCPVLREDVPRLVKALRDAWKSMDLPVPSFASKAEERRWLAQTGIAAARAEAEQLRAELADLHPLLDATQAQLTRVGREAAQWKAKYEGLLISMSPDQEAHTAMVAERDEWKCHRARCAADLEKVKKERDEARRTIEAAGRYMQGLDEAIARAERAEAAAGQMRAALLAMGEVAEVAGMARGDQFTQEWRDKLVAARGLLLTALATDAGKGYISPEAHAAVVAERDRLAAAAQLEVGERFLHWRDVESPCETCGGSGRRDYGNTTTWRGGCGGQSITGDVCDRCWGSGDAKRKGADLRKLTALTALAARAEKAEAERNEARAQVAVMRALVGRARTHLEYVARVVAKANVAYHVDTTWGHGSARNISAGIRHVVAEIDDAIDSETRGGK